MSTKTKRGLSAIVLFTVAVIVIAFSWSPLFSRLSTTTVTETRTVTTGTVTVTTTVPAPDLSDTTDYEVYFSPNGGCEARLLYWIRKANVSIHAMVFSITLDRIVDALISAHRRGIDVRIVMERSTIDSSGSDYGKLKAAGVPIRLPTTHGLMHNKVAVIDEIVVITGSYNWTRDAEQSNSENMIILTNAKIANTYEREFQKIWSHSGP